MQMQYLDIQVVEQSLQWLQQEQSVWLCTVVATFGSSPRSPGSLFAANSNGNHIGSLSGGCVEEDFLARLRDGEFNSGTCLLRYGDKDPQSTPNVTLPCGGILEILIEKFLPNTDDIDHLQILLDVLKGQENLLRSVSLDNGQKRFIQDTEVTGPRIQRDTEINEIQIRIGPAARLIIAGMSPVAEVCANFATTLGFEVIICDPRENAFDNFALPGIQVHKLFPTRFITSPQVCHQSTAVVALTHDPRIDDLAMIDAVATPAFYIGVMGSRRSSIARAQRLRRSGGLTEEQIARIRMPIGLNLGSKTPAEIALAVMADIVRTLRAKSKKEL